MNGLTPNFTGEVYYYCNLPAFNDFLVSNNFYADLALEAAVDSLGDFGLMFRLTSDFSLVKMPFANWLYSTPPPLLIDVLKIVYESVSETDCFSSLDKFASETLSSPQFCVIL